MVVMTMRPHAQSRRMTGPIIAIGISYAVLAGAAILLTRLSHGIALLWVANAPLLAALCVWPQRCHRALVVSAAAGLMIALAVVSPMRSASPALIVIDIGEAVLAAWLLYRAGVAGTLFKTIQSVSMFVAIAGVIAPAVSGVLGAALAHWYLGIAFGRTWMDWLIGHGLGTMIGTPLALLVVGQGSGWRYLAQPARALQAALLVLLTGGTAWFVFRQNALPLLFLPMLPVVVGTFMLRRLGSATSIVVVAMVGGLMTINGYGPVMLVRGDEAFRLQFFQFYLAVLFLTALPIAAALAQRDALTRALGESEARYRLLADNATDIMLTLDPDGTIRFASAAIRALGYYDPESLIGRNASILIHPDCRARVIAVHRASLASPERTFTVEYRAVKANGDVGWFETNMRAVRAIDGGISAVISVVRDLGIRKLREAELERAAATDPLTGLLNRSAFRDCVAAAAAGDRPASLALLDIDHFKRVNDGHGHAAGDAALLMLADLLRESVRAGDSIGRIGGEEFAILFADLPLPAATAICDRLRMALEARLLTTPAGATLTIRTSIGVGAVSPAVPIDQLFGVVDDALYRAKANGRNRTEVAEMPALL